MIIDPYEVIPTTSGLVVITTPVFAAVDSDDEIAAILSHEIAHFIAGHSEEEASKQSIGYLSLLPAVPCFASLASLPLAIPSLALGVWWLLSPVADDKYEAEADDIALLLMAEAGFDPRVVTSIFERLNGLADPVPGANRLFTDETWNELTHEAWNSKHPHESPAISRITSNVWKALYLTGKGPSHPDLSREEKQDLEKSKQR
ncbi:MAG: hypothetical protein Q9171_006002 [Xanthocarpia ochracea]